MLEFYIYMENNMMNDSEYRVFTPSIVNSAEFIDKYKTAANSYAEYNKNMTKVSQVTQISGFAHPNR